MSNSIHDDLGGAEIITNLAEAWHERCLSDEVVAHAFSHGFRSDHTERLAAYWIEQLGGPPVYTDRLGTHSKVVVMHSGNGAHPEMDRRSLACFDSAMDDVQLTDPLLRARLHDWFAWAIGVMDSYPVDAADVPPDLPMPVWT